MIFMKMKFVLIRQDIFSRRKVSVAEKLFLVNLYWFSLNQKLFLLDKKLFPLERKWFPLG